MNRHSKRYIRYINSRAWKERRSYLFALLPQQVCKRTGCPHSPTECHHLHYRTLGDEKQEDVEFLCVEHHKEADRTRELKEADQRAEQQYQSCLEQFMKRRYGANWDMKFSQSAAESILDAHLEEKERWER